MCVVPYPQKYCEDHLDFYYVLSQNHELLSSTHFKFLTEIHERKWSPIFNHSHPPRFIVATELTSVKGKLEKSHYFLYQFIDIDIRFNDRCKSSFCPYLVP